MGTVRPEPPPPAQSGQATFGALLRRYRLAAGLSQEELAERAGLSVQGLSALENGRRQAPYRHTVGVLAQALELSAAETTALEASVPRARPSAASATSAPPSAPPEQPVAAAGPASVPDAAKPMVDAAPAPDAAAAPAPAGAPVTGLAPAPLPTGTLTFLLTDIEGSTPLWEGYPAAMQGAMARHDALVDEALARHGGRQVKERGEGDSVLAVFTAPSAAVAAACALQRALLTEHWPPEIPLRVRVGLHTGEAELRGIGYYGLSVNRTARIRSLGHGGQILLSQATADLVRGLLPAGTSLRALGTHRLKGMEQPEEIYQVLHPGLPAEFPPLASPSAHPSNLPVALTSFIGREREQGEVRALLAAARLVTLTGAGGAGKTRLALAVAEALIGEYADGVWLVELAPLADPALVTQAVAAALGVREQPNRALLDVLLGHLKERRLLLVPDNCEHLVDACAALADAVLRACAGVRILATSREGLGVAGERLYRVPSLAVPDPDHLPTPEEVAEFEAVSLFVTRAQERRQDFSLTAQNARSVAQICARLDGLPLAIELAAARVGGMPVEAIATRLDDRFRLLTGGPRTAVPRQQTLRAALEWSYDLLGEGERRLLARLSVFAGGWTLEAVEAVCGGPGIEAWEILDLLGGLVSKSLVLLEEGEADAEVRYGLLETVRQYGWERLVAGGEMEVVRDRHLEWCLMLAEQSEPESPWLQDKGPLLAGLEREHDNLRTALRWCCEGCRHHAATVQLAGALAGFWFSRGRLREGSSWLEAALLHGSDAPAGLRARALHGAASLAFFLGDLQRSRALHIQSLALYRELGNKDGTARALNGLGNVLCEVGIGDLRQSEILYEESLLLRRELGNKRSLAVSLNNLGVCAQLRGRYERAESLITEALVLSKELGDKTGIAFSTRCLGGIALAQGKYGRARDILEEGLAMCRVLGGSFQIGASLGLLGEAALLQGDHARARGLLREGLTVCREPGWTWLGATLLSTLGLLDYLESRYEEASAQFCESLIFARDQGARYLVAVGLERMAALRHAQDLPEAAAVLFGAAEALRETIGTPLPVPYQRLYYDQAVTSARSALGEEAFASRWAAGGALPQEHAIALAFEST